MMHTSRVVTTWHFNRSGLSQFVEMVVISKDSCSWFRVEVNMLVRLARRRDDGLS